MERTLRSAARVGLAMVLLLALGLVGCESAEEPAPPPVQQPVEPAEPVTPQAEPATPTGEPTQAPPASEVQLAQAVTPAPAQQGIPWVWWEGEDFTDTNVPDPQRMEPGDITEPETQILSGGRWFCPRGPEDQGPYQARYTVQVPQTTTYDLYVRKFWKHGPFKWRFGEGEWQTLGRDIALLDNTYMRQHWGANWVHMGQVELDAGEQTFTIEMLDPAGSGCIDAFLLIDGPFMPRGQLKPDQVTGDTMEGFFAWEPPADPLTQDNPIDLRYLNEDQAGQDGFVRREGGDFVLGSGEPVRFWMVQGDALFDMSRPMIDWWAARLAKYGVNAVRLGMLGMFNQYKEGNVEALDANRDKLHYLVSALKREGIYVYLGHLYWHTSVQMAEKHGFEGYGDGKGAFGLLMFDPRMQEFYLKWAEALLTPENPYTGLPLAKDPAVGWVEIQNESSLFFWTFRPNAMVPQTREKAEKAFGDWAARKYGSVQAALDAWGPDKSPAEIVGDISTDHPDQGRLGLYDIGRLVTADWAAPQRNAQRGADQLQWMFEHQRDYYRTMIDAMRDRVGVQSLITCSNWKTADPANLGALERLSYTEGDAVCRNVYFDVKYESRPERFYAVDVGDTYKDFSALKPPAVPEAFTNVHVMDWPDMYTENNWCRPGRYRAEWPFLVATYGAMTGMDGWTFFALESAQWQTPMTVWEVNDPSILGQFPAAALIFRSGMVEEAPAAVTEHANVQQFYQSQPAAIFEMTGADALWVSQIGELEGAGSGSERKVDPKAFFVGKVNREFTDGEPSIESVDLAQYIDPQAQTVKSLTGELLWDYGTGLVRLDAPRAQGATGFLSQAGTIELADVTIESGNEYGNVLVVALDGKPISQSSRVLVQTGTEDVPFGYATEPAGEGFQKITNLGGYPSNVRKVAGTVTVANPKLTKATVLNGNGDRTDRQGDLQANGEAVTLTLPADSLYTLLEAGE